MKNLNTLNDYLFNTLERLNNLDMKDLTNAKVEIARSNAISQTGKTLIQSIGVQMMVQNTKQSVSKDIKELVLGE